MLSVPALVGCSSSSPSTATHDAGSHVPDAISINLPDVHQDTSHPGPASDASTDTDNGSVSTTYPAFAVDMPTVVNNGGGVLASPVVVTISWPASDTNVAAWEGMGDGLGASAYWKAAAVPYGVGPAISGDANHIHMTDPLPSSFGYSDLDNYVLAAITAAEADAGAPQLDAGADAGTTDGGKNPRWPVPTMMGGNAQTIYSLIIPQSVAITDPGSGMSFCTEGALGYHANVMVGSTPVAYSVSLECEGQTVADVEETMAHEYVEAATNPFPSAQTIGWVGFDPNHLSWDIFTGFNDELADACQSWQDSYFQEPAPFPYWVQSVWSNTNAAAGHDPCAPASATPYQGLTLFPAQQKMVNINLQAIGMSIEMTRGFVAKVGETVTFQVGFYSDAKMSGPLAIGYDFPSETQLFNEAGNTVANGAAMVTIDLMSGENGQKANVSVTPTMAGPLGFQIMALTWDPPTGLGSSMYLPHYLPLLISNQ